MAADLALAAGMGDPPAPGRGSGNTAAGSADEGPAGQKPISVTVTELQSLSIT